jgi:hypothetical protein
MFKNIFLAPAIAIALTSAAIAHDKHTELEIPLGQPVPTLNLTVSPDGKKGWNLQLKTTNFRFAPENVNKANTFGEGHAHLMVNGKKLTRLYSNWYYLESLPVGENKITVSLNSNAHEDFTVKGKEISATQTIMVPASKPK